MANRAPTISQPAPSGASNAQFMSMTMRNRYLIVHLVLLALAGSALAHHTPATAASTTGSAWNVTALINKTTAIGEQTMLTVRGAVSREAAGKKVILQRRVPAHTPWQATGSATVKDDGSYLVKDKPGMPGVNEYRVVMRASRGRARGLSKSLSVQVYVWERLANRAVDMTENVRVGPATIGGDRYPASLLSIVSGRLGKVEYSLDRRCTEFSGIRALDDASASGSEGDFFVTTDVGYSTGGLVYPGQGVEDTIWLHGSRRISIDFGTSTSPAAIAALGTPEILCTR